MNGYIEINVRSYFRGLSILFFSLQLPQIMLVAIGLFLKYGSGEPLDPAMIGKNVTFIGIGAAVAGAAIFMSGQVFGKKLEEAKSQPLENKSITYRAACIFQWCILEAASVISFILFFTGDEPILLFIPVFMVGFAIAKTKPSRDKFKRDLSLDFKEEAIMDDDEAIIGRVNKVDLG
ncbi:MAG: hypothetical protein ACOZCO_12925 [Bacteroidota bacterium]